MPKRLRRCKRHCGTRSSSRSSSGTTGARPRHSPGGVPLLVWQTAGAGDALPAIPGTAGTAADPRAGGAVLLLARHDLYIPRAAGRRGAEYPAGAGGGAVCPGCPHPEHGTFRRCVGRSILPGAYARGWRMRNARWRYSKHRPTPSNAGARITPWDSFIASSGTSQRRWQPPARWRRLVVPVETGVSRARRRRLRGWIYARCGAWQEGLAACQQALEYAPDAYETALNLGFLGYVYLEKGEVTQALPVLESAVQAAQQYRSQQVQSWFKVFLGEAYRMNNQLEQAQDLAMQGLRARSSHQPSVGHRSRPTHARTHRPHQRQPCRGSNASPARPCHL